jgi:hypothetical protein
VHQILGMSTYNENGGGRTHSDEQCREDSWATLEGGDRDWAKALSEAGIPV